MPLGASATELVPIEYMDTGACLPWNLSIGYPVAARQVHAPDCQCPLVSCQYREVLVSILGECVPGAG